MQAVAYHLDTKPGYRELLRRLHRHSRRLRLTLTRFGFTVASSSLQSESSCPALTSTRSHWIQGLPKPSPSASWYVVRTSETSGSLSSQSSQAVNPSSSASIIPTDRHGYDPLARMWCTRERTTSPSSRLRWTALPSGAAQVVAFHRSRIHRHRRQGTRCLHRELPLRHDSVMLLSMASRSLPHLGLHQGLDRRSRHRRRPSPSTSRSLVAVAVAIFNIAAFLYGLGVDEGILVVAIVRIVCSHPRVAENMGSLSKPSPSASIVDDIDCVSSMLPLQSLSTPSHRSSAGIDDGSLSLQSSTVNPSSSASCTDRAVAVGSSVAEQSLRTGVDGLMPSSSHRPLTQCPRVPHRPRSRAIRRRTHLHQHP